MLKHSLILQPSYWPDGTINNSLKSEEQHVSAQCYPIATRANIFLEGSKTSPDGTLLRVALKVREESTNCRVAATEGN